MGTKSLICTKTLRAGRKHFSIDDNYNVRLAPPPRKVTWPFRGKIWIGRSLVTSGGNRGIQAVQLKCEYAVGSQSGGVFMAYSARNDDNLEDWDAELESSDPEPVGDVDGYTGDDSNSVLESVDVNSESEPEDDQPPSEETPPQLHSDSRSKRRRVGVSPVHSNLGTTKRQVPGGSRHVSACVTPSQTPSRERRVNPKVAFNSSRKIVQHIHVPAQSDPKGGDGGESLSAVLGNITNMLGAVIERLDKTESKLESMERKLNSPSSSSAASGADTKRKIPIIVRVSLFLSVVCMPRTQFYSYRNNN